MHICVCICTYKRPRLLALLLRRLALQHTAGEFSYSIVVADNDAAQSARATVAEAAAYSPVATVYCHEPRQNIALVRNQALAHARGDFIAFIDDDEYPDDRWLLNALHTCQQYGVAGVLGPVRPYFDHKAPDWLVKGGFCERPEYPTGRVLAWRETRTGNVLFRGELVRGNAAPFRAEFGLGGEDQDFFKRLIEQGAVFVWCNEAVVHELVPPERCKRRYMLERAWLRGQNEQSLADAYGICKSLVAVPAYLLLLPFTALRGSSVSMRYLIRLCDHAGKLLGLFGVRPLAKR